MAAANTVARWAVALAALALPLAAAAADPLRMGPSQAGDGRLIEAAADDAATWQADGVQWMLLRGNALVRQESVQVSGQEIVLRVNPAAPPRSFADQVAVFARGDVRIENGLQKLAGPTALADLASRKGVQLTVPRGRVRRDAPRADDPLLAVAQAALRGDASPVDTGIVRTAALAPSVPPPPAVTPVAPAPKPFVPTQNPATDLPVPITPPSAAPPLPAQGSLPALGPTVPPGNGPEQRFSIRPRTSMTYQSKGFQLPTGEHAVLITGGVILAIRDVKGGGVVDIEADRLVGWSRGNTEQLFEGMSRDEGTGQEVEFYLTGNVELRTSNGRSRDQQTLRAEQVYYHAKRKVAVAVTADLELRNPRLPDALHLKADELYQLGEGKFEGIRANVSSSRLPSDPGIKLVLATVTIEEETRPKRSIFGFTVEDRSTGEDKVVKQHLVHGEQVKLELEGVPVFYTPFLNTTAEEPLGPLQSFGFRQDRVFGTQILTSFNGYSLFGIDPLPGTRWRLEADYLSRRGPALGTQYYYSGKALGGVGGDFTGFVKLYGILDDGRDRLGGDRPFPYNEQPDARGRVLARHRQELPEGFVLEGQLSLLSDKNFLEQYFKQEFDTDLNQETFLFLRQQKDVWNWSVLAKPNVRDWVTEDVRLPEVRGNLLGLSPFDLFTYNARASAGYYQLRPTQELPLALRATEQQRVGTGRADLNQDLSLPFTLGPVKVVPYGTLDLTGYTDDLTGDASGRLVGGGGVRASLPFSRLYRDVQSELFNVNGIYHKAVLGTNYYIAGSNHRYTDYPQIDRLNDDASDQSLREISPLQPFLNPRYGAALLTSPIYDPQRYAIRRLVDNRVDTLDQIEVLQTDLRQRWQTKRGFPGSQHTVDWLTFDLSASFFPHPDRDNFGKSAGFVEYDTVWNVGDRTALTSSGYYDPFTGGPHEWTVGAFLNRPDRTNFYVGYRMIDPIDSRALTGAVTYVFSPKYAITASSTYDFGTNQALTNALVVTRVGSDLSVNVGFTYNALVNNFGFTLELLPNLVAMRRQTGPFGGVARELLR